jgi:hypothetical protein
VGHQREIVDHLGAVGDHVALVMASVQAARVTGVDSPDGQEQTLPVI